MSEAEVNWYFADWQRLAVIRPSTGQTDVLVLVQARWINSINYFLSCRITTQLPLDSSLCEQAQPRNRNRPAVSHQTVIHIHTMVLLTQLPLEIVNHVLSFVDPEDLPRVNTTCQYLYHAVKDNKALFRAVYLRHLVSLQATFALSVPHIHGDRLLANQAGFSRMRHHLAHSSTGFRKSKIWSS